MISEPSAAKVKEAKRVYARVDDETFDELMDATRYLRTSIQDVIADHLEEWLTRHKPLVAKLAAQKAAALAKRASR